MMKFRADIFAADFELATLASKTDFERIVLWSLSMTKHTHQ
jgi:hypothetical protein